MSLEPGTRLGRYEISTPLGAGGMGEVYLARDTELDRVVALKVLPAETTADRQRLQRFLQEARAASKLKSANVAHIYEIGDADGLRFIAMEYVEGELLDAHIRGRQLSAAEITRIATEIARALEEAHSKGITHRDIKPQNIIVTPAGDVKVLDFGLAKLDAAPTTSGETPDNELATRVKTTPGVVMGTVNYMSPEQAMGRADVDHRTDIFSLGVVLYEMATGRLPFAGASITETIDRIVHAQPEAIARFNYEVPAELEVVIKKALRKSRDERYQTAREMLVDLRALQRELNATSHSQLSGVPDSRSSIGTTTPATSSDEQRTAILTDERHAHSTAGAVASDHSTAVRSTSSIEYIAVGIKRHKSGAVLALLVIAVVLAGAGFGFYKFATRSRPQRAVSFAAAKLQRLTTTGKATGVAISPDGKYVVHVEDDGGQQSLWTRQVATQSNVEIVAPTAVTYDSLTFSPDGDYIYYSVSSQDFPQRTLFQVPTLGGAPRRVLENLDRDTISFSPDGKQFAFVRSETGKEFALMIASANGTGERKLVAHKNPPESIGYPTWSPDGKLIAYVVLNHNTNDDTVMGAQVADGSTKPLTSQRWFRFSALAWLADGSGLLMLATPQRQFVHQIWQLSYPEGEAHQLTNDLNDYVGMSLTADSGALAVVKTETQSNVWVAPAGAASRARPVTSGAGRVSIEVAFSPDGGRIVYSSSASGDEDIWMVNADGGSPKQLTANARVNGHPSVSPDGRYIIFVSDRSGVPHIWRMTIDGNDQRQLTDGRGEQSPEFSPDGRWVIYRTSFGKVTVWKAPADGGEPVQLSDKYSREPTVSPDSKLVAYCYRDDNTPWRMAVAPLEGGQPLKTFDLPTTGGFPLHWTTDGHSVAYVDTKNGVSNIVAQPLDGGAPKQLTDFKTDRIFWFDFSRDGRQLALSRGTQTSDVILIKDFR